MTKKDPKERPYASELLNYPIIKVAEEFKRRNKKKNAQKTGFASEGAQIGPKTKKEAGSYFNKIIDAFGSGYRSERLRIFRNEKFSTEDDRPYSYNLETSSFKKLVYVNCLPKAMDAMSEFLSDASTTTGDSSD